MRNIYRTYREHYKALFFLGLPIVIGQIGVIVLGFADTLMIGHHSTVELGAASFVNNVFNLAIIFSTGFSYGLTPVVGGLYGTHQFAPAGQALRNSLLANLMVALLLTLCMTVLYLNIELGPVESRLANADFIGNFKVIEYLFHNSLRLIPLLGCAYIFIAVIGIPL